MVAGMAMAPAAAASQDGGQAIDVYGTKYSMGLSDRTHGNWKDLGNVVFMILLFKPIHMEARGMLSIAYDMVVWGSLPRPAGRNSLPPSVLELAACVVRRSSPALTPRRPTWPARA